MSTTVDSGLMLNSYVGDVTGDGRYNSLDPLRIQRYLVNLDRWFAQYPLVDPVIIADITGDGRVNSLDSLFMQRYLVNIPVTYITAPPVSSVTQTTGLDPIIRMPGQISPGRGKMFEVPVEIYNSDRLPVEVSSFEFSISIDPAILRFVSMRSIGQGFSRQDVRKGLIAFGGVIPATKLNPGESVQFAWLTLQARPSARLVDTTINMLDEVGIGRGRYLTSLNSGDLVLGRAPSSGFDDLIDTKVSIRNDIRNFPNVKPSLTKIARKAPLSFLNRLSK
ncbi:MAG: dockerin type I domain-containing protein [Isosphaeraceae bacterium]